MSGWASRLNPINWARRSWRHNVETIKYVRDWRNIDISKDYMAHKHRIWGLYCGVAIYGAYYFTIEQAPETDPIHKQSFDKWVKWQKELGREI